MIRRLVLVSLCLRRFGFFFFLFFEYLNVAIVTVVPN